MLLKTLSSQVTVTHQLLQQRQWAVGTLSAIEVVALGQISGQCHVCGPVHYVLCQTLAVNSALGRVV